MKFKLRKLLILLTLLAIGLSGCQSKPQKPSLTLHVVSTTDLHGYALTSSEQNISYDRIANYVESLQEGNEPVLLLDSGDYIQGSAIVNLSQGVSAIQAMNAVGYDAVTIGNHEFDFSGDHLLSLQKMATFPMISANVRYQGQNPFASHLTFNIDELKVAVVGVSTPETYWKTSPLGIQGWEFLDPIETLKPLVKSLRKNHDLIIVIAHLGSEGDYTSTALAQNVPGIDLILDGHDHTQTPTGRIVGHTQIFNSGSHARALGHTKVNFTKGLVTQINSKALDVSAEELNAGYTMRSNALKVQAVLNAIQQESEVVLSEVLLSVPVNLEGGRQYVRTQESNLGRLIGDSFRFVTEAELALVNGGGIRTSIASGDVTRGDILSVLPFNNTLVTIDVTGQELKDALEHGLATYPEANGGFPHVSGFTYTYDVHAERNNRVQQIMINNQPIDMQQTYSLVVVSFLASGGDGYTMLKKPIVREFSTDSDAFVRYLQQADEGTFSAIINPRGIQL